MHVKATVIVVAAGKGRRFRSKEKKPFAKLGKRPLLIYALLTFQKSPLIDDVVLVVDKSSIEKAERLVKRYRINKVKCVIKGGRLRTQSVKNGLARVDKDSDVVLVHDGVRPFVHNGLVKEAVNAAVKFGAAILAHPVKPTIKISKDGSFVSYTPERRHLWEAETPQVFRKHIIDRAYKKICANRLFTTLDSEYLTGFTDDSSLVELLGVKVKIIKGDYRNIKITTVEDLKIAEALLRNKK